MTGVLVVGLACGGTLHRASLEVATLGRALAAALGVPLRGALIGDPNAQAAEMFAKSGLAEVCVADNRGPRPLVAEYQVAFLQKAVVRTGASIVLAPHTLDSAEWLPLLAARWGASVVTDCQRLQVEDGVIVATKAVCGGAVCAEYTLSRAVSVLTVSPGTFEPAVSAPSCQITTIDIGPPDARSAVVEDIPDTALAGPALTQARIVVAGGLGVGSKDQWTIVTDAAVALNAAVGATRAVVESGWVPSALQVGYSGAKVAPDLYIAIGISGAIHHLAGIAQAKVVVAINSDPSAEIFKVARFGVVGDAKAVMPAFAARVRAIRNDSGTG